MEIVFEKDGWQIILVQGYGDPGYRFISPIGEITPSYIYRGSLESAKRLLDKQSKHFRKEFTAALVKSWKED